MQMPALCLAYASENGSPCSIPPDFRLCMPFWAECLQMGTVALSGVARASWNSVVEHAGIPRCPPVVLHSQLHNLVTFQTPENTNGHFSNGQAASLNWKSVDFSTGLSIFNRYWSFWLHRCLFLGMTPPLPWLSCLIHEMKVLISSYLHSALSLHLICTVP